MKVDLYGVLPNQWVVQSGRSLNSRRNGSRLAREVAEGSPQCQGTCHHLPPSLLPRLPPRPARRLHPHAAFLPVLVGRRRFVRFESLFSAKIGMRYIGGIGRLPSL